MKMIMPFYIYILIVGSNDKLVKSAKNMVNSKYEMENMWGDNMILGIIMIQTTDGLILR